MWKFSSIAVHIYVLCFVVISMNAYICHSAKHHIRNALPVIFVLSIFSFYGSATVSKGNDFYAMYKICDAAAVVISMRNANIRFRSINRKCAAYNFFALFSLVSSVWMNRSRATKPKHKFFVSLVIHIGQCSWHIVSSENKCFLSTVRWMAEGRQ